MILIVSISNMYLYFIIHLFFYAFFSFINMPSILISVSILFSSLFRVLNAFALHCYYYLVVVVVVCWRFWFEVKVYNFLFPWKYYHSILCGCGFGLCGSLNNLVTTISIKKNINCCSTPEQKQYSFFPVFCHIYFVCALFK